MSLVYLAAGLYLLLSGSFINLSDVHRYGIGAMLIIYSVFRFYRAVIKKREDDYGNDE
jgi:hypothetical protein